MFTYEEYSNVFKIKNKDTPIICNAFNDIIFSIPIVFMNFISGCGVKIKFKPFRILTYSKGKCVIQSTFFSPKYIANKIKSIISLQTYQNTKQIALKQPLQIPFFL